ncbi:hypothetical protein [Caulobacter sp.]|uniref:beta strand repeat-containing protein n=1 Tax=Caulobacter sp. TaxID=78 RepID=UPI002B4662A4|nr:hypothetical protein [Caulobacter sp.]HJV43182.1 hypothetical protein [Caulobacter sp.]
MAYNNLTDLKAYFKNANAGTAATAAQEQALLAIANQNAAGSLSDEKALAALLDIAADSTTSVSVGTYQFFLGYAPSTAGLTFLNNAYVGTGSQAGFNAENRFIAQSISLALGNATAKASFDAAYGALSISDVVKTAYDVIIGKATAQAAGVNLDNAYKFFTDQQAYFTAFVKQVLPGASAADQALAVKAAIVGEIMFQGNVANGGAGLGSYAAATNTLLKDLADDGVLAANNVNGIDLFANYGGTGTVGTTLALTTGIDTPVATVNNDTINAIPTTLTALDTIDGLAGNDTLVLADATGGSDWTGIAGLTVKNVETVQLKSVGTGKVDSSAWTGVTSLQTTTVGGVNATAAGTTSIVVSDDKLAAGTVVVNGGSAVSVTTATTSTGTIAVGGTTAPTGAVTVKATVNGTGATAQGNINVTGGTTVNVTTVATQATVNTSTTQAAVTVTGATTTTGVTVNQTAAVAADATTKGIIGGSVTINDANGAHATKGGSIATVTIANAGAVAITDNSLATLNVSGVVGTVGVTTGAGATVDTLALNLGAGSTGAVTLGSNYKALNVAVSGANTVANVVSTATALKVSGSDVLTLTSAAGLTAATSVTVTGTAGLKADLSGLGTVTKVDTSGTTGTSTLNIDVTKVAFTGGAGSDLITLTGALASGGKFDLGAGNDRLSGTAVAASTTSVVDGGTGVDTISSSVINAGNGSVFKNFEILGLNNTVLDAALLTGSTLTGLELLASGGTYTNITAAQSLTVATNAGAGTTVLTFSNVGGTADAYAITFAGVGGATSGAAATYDAGTLSIANIENVTIASGSASGFSANNIDLTDAAARSLVITGSQALDVSFVGSFGTAGATGLATIDASAATGAITLNTTNAGIATGGLTVSTGSGADTVTLASAATVSLGLGNDTVTVANAATTITLGGGNDTVNVAASVSFANMVAITDTANAGDAFVFANQGADAFTATKVVTTTAQSLAEALDMASTADGSTNGAIKWFQYNGNTYIVEDVSLAATFAATDHVVKLTGLIDLSTASYSAATNTLTLA